MATVKCPRCYEEYELIDKSSSKKLEWLCTTCWYEKHVDNKKMEPEIGNDAV